MTKSAYFVTKPASKMTDLKAQNGQKLPFSPVFDLLSRANLAVLGADCQRAAAEPFGSSFLDGLNLSSGAPCLPFFCPLLGKLNPAGSAVPLVPSPGAGSQVLAGVRAVAPCRSCCRFVPLSSEARQYRQICPYWRL